jgi:anaerobic selenocysteine-containing dehydrogenase
MSKRFALTRRQLLATGGAAAAAVGFTGCQPPQREFMAQSRLRLAEDTVNAFENHYATACRGCGAGCGTIVRVIEGRAKKVEGNPDHPVNEGKLCARGQSAVQEQYHPDRVTSPMSRRALRAPLGPLLPDSWDQALSEFVRPLRAAQQGGRAADVVFITGPLSGHQAMIVDRFTRGFGAEWLTLDPIAESPMREAVRRVFGQDQLPDFDVRNAHFVLSFGADWLESWISPVHLGIDYGRFRQGDYRPGANFKPHSADGKPRGYIVHISPHFDGTAANADEWIFCNPGTEGLVALSIAQVIASEGLGDAGAFGGAPALANFAPERVFEQTGADPAKVKHAAQEFAKQKPSIAIGGGLAGAHTNGTANLSAIFALNHLVGSVNRDGGVKFNPVGALSGVPGAARASSLGEFERLVARLNAGQVQAVLVYGANPIHELPTSIGFADALAKAPFIVSFNSFMDETAVVADLILPSHLPLEDWGSNIPDPAPGQQVVTIQQPVVQPAFDTRSFFDVLLAAGDELGGRTRAQLPWRTFRDLLREDARRLQAHNRGSVRETNFEAFWAKLLQQGGWWGPLPAPAAPAAPAAPGPVPAITGVTQVASPRFDGDATQYPYHLVLFEHPHIGHGEAAHIPWLASLPDPITSATWRTWVEVNPRVAREQGLQEGDIVAITSPQGTVEAPVYVSPAAPPNVLAMPLGWGHKEMGRWAKGRGVNPMALLSSLADQTTGASAYGSARVSMRKTGRSTRVVKYEGNVPAYQIPEDQVLQITRGDAAGSH